jgi:hypothetical protein
VTSRLVRQPLLPVAVMCGSPGGRRVGGGGDVPEPPRAAGAVAGVARSAPHRAVQRHLGVGAAARLLEADRAGGGAGAAVVDPSGRDAGGDGRAAVRAVLLPAAALDTAAGEGRASFADRDDGRYVAAAGDALAACGHRWRSSSAASVAKRRTSSPPHGAVKAPDRTTGRPWPKEEAVDTQTEEEDATGRLCSEAAEANLRAPCFVMRLLVPR